MLRGSGFAAGPPRCVPGKSLRGNRMHGSSRQIVVSQTKEGKMMRTAKQMRRGVFGAAVAASLAFGGSQAMASPAQTLEAGPKCTLDWCDRFCKAIGAHSGTCLPNEGCACAL